MAKQRVTKAELILRELVDSAHSKVVALQNELDVAMATHNAHFEALARLQQSRQPKAEKKAKKPSVSQAAAKEPTADKDLKCGTCGNPPDHADHDRHYLKSHDFEPPKSVARVPRKSRTKIEPERVSESSIPSSETQPDSVGNAALAASNRGD